MSTLRQQFLQHVAQTSDIPMLLEIERAEGSFLFDTAGKRYLDLIAGISVSVLGHRHPEVVAAIKNQADRYLHTLVYGEYVLSPQVDTASAITFASAFLPKAGNMEPKVVATAFKVDLNKLSEPVVGNTGIFVVSPSNKTPGVASGNIAQIRQQSQVAARGGARNGLIQTLREKADVEDNRSRFF